ncbi:hypothetical protein TNIN_295351 [Trichonephila inaurata madagascariensis]|uniref:Uncharacterized protein n=1 Tax=Trichonephila inaurata madagascariensis TaxID=2747483 RepID=A0A8X7CPL5_9ARAC|nr:hypothetical protein TNIN_295351 [Trichonephila inaurata madagascariensis]
MTSVAETEESEMEIVCKKCGEDFKDDEGEKEKSKLAAETSVNENISVSSTSKISSPCNKISQDDSSQSLPLATSKQLYSPSTKTLKGEASRSRTSSVASHKLKSSKRSLPATTTKSSEREEPKMVNTNYPMYVTPPQSIESFQALKDNSLSVRDSTVENLFEPCKRTCSAIGYSSLPSECIKKDSVQSLTLATPEQRSFSSPQNIRVEPSGNVTTSNESYILQSPRSSCIASIGRPNEVEVLYTVDTKYPTCGTTSAIYSVFIYP